jgi:hypothetical protein
MQASPDTFLTRAGLYSHDLAVAPDPALQFAEVPIMVWSNHGYEFRLLRLAEIPALLDPDIPAALRWPTPLLDLIALLWSPVLDWLHKGLRETADIQRCGYWITRREVVIGELGAAAEVIGALRLRGAIPAEVSFGSPAEIFNRLSSLGGSMWPPVLGPAIRDAGEGWVIVDFRAATECLRRALAKPRLDPDQDLAWSIHFEKSIQEALDASAWKPSPQVRKFRGRTLRIAGADVADVDAIGERDQDLMIVSCKSRAFSETWNRGDNNAVRAVEDRVDRAVEELEDRIGKLRRTPHGDNYDFSGYRQILGAVVFPSVPWTQNPDAWADVLPGLRVASSAGEFADWIRRA